MRYFGSNNVEGAVESWVEAEMSWVEVDEAGWSWVEVDGTGWRWVHGLVIPIKKLGVPRLPIEEVTRRYSIKKVLQTITSNSEENTKKETPAQFSCEFGEIFKNTIVIEHIRTNISIKNEL